MVFGGDVLEGCIGSNSKVSKCVSGVADDGDSLDAQDLLVENCSLRRQVATWTEKARRTQEENDDFRRQIILLQQQQQQLMTSHRRFETEFEQAGKMAAKEAKVDGDKEMWGLKAGEEGYLDAKVSVLSKRLAEIAKRSCWLQVQVEQARDQAADASRRQVDAERIVLRMMKEKGPGASTEYLRTLAPDDAPTSPVYLPVGSDIWKDEKAFAEGLPKTIPSRVGRCAALVTSALANGQSMRSTVGRTIVSNNSNMAPTARPGNVWATLLNGGAAGGKVEFA